MTRKIVIDEASFWIMTIVVLWRVRLRKLNMPIEMLEQSFNMTLPEVLRSDRQGQIDHAIDLGLIQISEQPLSPEWRMLTFEDPIVWVSLTALGSSVWEEVSKADWSIYVEVSGGYLEDDEKETTITCIDKDHLQKYVEIWKRHEEHVGHSKIIEGTETYSSLESWEPSYWKLLTGASMVTYRVKENKYNEECQSIPPDYFEETTRISAQLDVLDRWYSVPTEFPQIVEVNEG